MELGSEGMVESRKARTSVGLGHNEFTPRIIAQSIQCSERARREEMERTQLTVMPVGGDHVQRRVVVVVVHVEQRGAHAVGVDELADVVELTVPAAEQELGFLVRGGRWGCRHRVLT